jgi:hypothetical protein
MNNPLFVLFIKYYSEDEIPEDKMGGVVARMREARNF